MSHEIEVREVTEQPMVSIRVTCKKEEIAAQLGDILPSTYKHVLDQGKQPSGPPFSRYHSHDAEELEIEAGCPTFEPVEGEGRIVSCSLPAGLVAFTWHVGPYDQLPGTYEALGEWIAANGYALAGAPWEVYWVDPGQEPDPAKWKTEVLWPVTKAGGES